MCPRDDQCIKHTKEINTKLILLQETKSSDETLQAVILSEGDTGSNTTVAMLGGQTVQVQVPTFQQTITLPNGSTALIQSPSASTKGDHHSLPLGARITLHQRPPPPPVRRCQFKVLPLANRCFDRSIEKESNSSFENLTDARNGGGLSQTVLLGKLYKN